MSARTLMAESRPRKATANFAEREQARPQVDWVAPLKLGAFTVGVTVPLLPPELPPLLEPDSLCELPPPLLPPLSPPPPGVSSPPQQA